MVTINGYEALKRSFSFVRGIRYAITSDTKTSENNGLRKSEKVISVLFTTVYYGTILFFLRDFVQKGMGNSRK